MEAMQGTGNLISSEKVEGTNVYNRTGDTLGSIHDLMIDKTSGHVVYAIMSFGGFLGMGNQYHPLPWSVLKYDTNMGGYVVNLDKQQLKGGPAYDADAEPDWRDRTYENKIHDYYGVGPYWLM
jgi:sporulation protein YlmC with PRC-barrel domain